MAHQKWNIKAEGFHSILVANARVDWLAMNDFFWLGAAWVKSQAGRSPGQERHAEWSV